MYIVNKSVKSLHFHDIYIWKIVENGFKTFAIRLHFVYITRFIELKINQFIVAFKEAIFLFRNILSGNSMLFFVLLLQLFVNLNI